MVGCAQQNQSSVQRMDAFMQVRVPGTIPVGSGQKQSRSYADTAYVIYMQAKQAPVWTKAWNASRSFRIETTEIKDSSVTAGIEKATGKHVHVEAEHGQRLYRLVLKKETDSSKPEKAVKEGEILLRGEEREKAVFYLVGRITELQSPLYQ